MIRFSASLALCLLISACSDANTQESATAATEPASAAREQGYELVEAISADGDEILIPYKRYVYPNGLTVLLHQDRSDPLVHVNVTYHVGSAREQPQRSGFAHFFEHMMFQGSAHVGDDEHFRIVTESGGTLNGTTNADRTNYFQTVPSNQLETALWLEADRMGFLLEAVSQEKFEIQRSTVKNERGQNYDNRPYGLVYEKIISSLYPSGHPYSWPVIGYPEDLDAATLEDLKDFFLRWYGPNNATLVVAGNIDEEKTLQLIDKYFGGVPPGPEVERAQPFEFALPDNRYISYVDRNIRFPLLVMAFPAVPYDHPDRVPLTALANIFGSGKKSLFYKEFVLTNRAIDASASNSAQELGGMFILEVQPYPGADLAEFEAEIREILSGFNANSITEEAMETFRGRNEAALINSLESVQGKASRLAMYDYLTGDPNYMPEELEAIRSVSREDVLRVFNEYLADESAVVLSVLTEDDPEDHASPDNFSPQPVLAVDDASVDDLEPRAVVDDFDRSQQPPSGQTPLVEVPAFWRDSLANGAEIIGTVNEEVPSVTLRLEFEGGHMLNDADNYGLAMLTAAMMNEGTEQLSAEQFEVELEKLGSRINVRADEESMLVTVSALSRNLEPTLELLEQRLFETAFTQENLDRLRRQQIEALQAAREQPSAIANNVYSKLLYGEDHSLSVPVAGEIDTVSSLTLDQVREFAAEALATEALNVVVVGDVEQQEIVPALAFLDRLPRDAMPLREQPPLPEIDGNTLYLVDKPGAAQSEIRIGYVTDMPYDATGEYFRTSLMNYVLGGAFSSRINLNLREDKGYTYGARSGFSSTELPGPFTASASVRTDTTADSVRQFVNEITGFRDNGITDQELAFMRSAIGQRDALRYETPSQKAGFLGTLIEYDLPADFVSQQAGIIGSIDSEEINALAQENLPFEEMLILVVGDKAVIQESLEALGYPIVELDVEGNPVP